MGERIVLETVLLALKRLSGLWPATGSGNTDRPVCDRRHKKAFVSYAAGVIYEILLSRGKVCIGQTRGRLNDRLEEHNWSLRTARLVRSVFIAADASRATGFN